MSRTSLIVSLSGLSISNIGTLIQARGIDDVIVVNTSSGWGDADTNDIAAINSFKTDNAVTVKLAVTAQGATYNTIFAYEVFEDLVETGLTFLTSTE